MTTTELANLYEAYLRADHAWATAQADAILNHADVPDDDLRKAMAARDCRDLLNDRLEKLVAYENAKAEAEEDFLDKIKASHEAARLSHDAAVRREEREQAMFAKFESGQKAPTTAGPGQ